MQVIESIKQARVIVGGGHGLSEPSKMPCRSWSLPANACKRGSALRTQSNSVCSLCYACKGRYVFRKAQESLQRRLAALADPRYVDAMILLIEKRPYFRWFDSGDLQSTAHLDQIIAIADGTPHTRHWLPTREYRIVQRRSTGIPDNLCVRLSADYIDRRARVPTALEDFPTSMVERRPAPFYRIDGRRSQFRPIVTCRAYTRDSRCGACRACWSRAVDISYPLH